MRNSISIVLSATLSASLLGACGGASNPVGDDTSGTPDATQELAGDLPVPTQGFQIVSPFIDVPRGVEVTKCFHTHLPVSAEVGVKTWESQMTPGSHHAILYFVGAAQAADGTVTDGGCGVGNIGGSGGIPVWTYSTQTAHQAMEMPAGIGMTVPANQAVNLEMHYLNTTDETLHVRVTVNGETFAPGATYTKAAAYVTYNTQISIPAGTPAAPGTGHAEGTCAVPAGAKFFTLSTHAHKQAVHTQVLDGAAADSPMVFQSDDWEHPGAMSWNDDPNFTFTSDNLHYECDYENPTSRTIQTGNSAQTDEMCMAVGYYFPADGPSICLDSTVLF